MSYYNIKGASKIGEFSARENTRRDHKISHLILHRAIMGTLHIIGIIVNEGLEQRIILHTKQMWYSVYMFKGHMVRCIVHAVPVRVDVVPGG